MMRVVVLLYLYGSGLNLDDFRVSGEGGGKEFCVFGGFGNVGSFQTGTTQKRVFFDDGNAFQQRNHPKRGAPFEGVHADLGHGCGNAERFER